MTPENMVRLTEAVSAVCPIDGITTDVDGSPVVQPREEATEEQIQAAEVVIKSFDESPQAAIEYKVAKLRLAAVKSLILSDDVISVAMRAVMRDVYSQINDVREACGLPRIMEHIVIPRLVESIKKGQGDAMLP